MFTDDQEEHILDLMYREQASFGQGHGCSVAWSQPHDGVVDEIRSEFIPKCEVPQIDFKLTENFDRLLSLKYLADGADHRSSLLLDIERFLDAYASWITNQLDVVTAIPDDLLDEKNLLIDRMRVAHQRMQKGKRLLENDTQVFEAFCDANKAMLLQRIHTEEEFSGRKHEGTDRPFPVEDLTRAETYTWRPFQLAFQLLTLSAIAFAEDPDREIVDLIWFPTGGGKTEAYLAVSAFLIFHRRMTYGTEGAGTAIIMRYTLRLLTAQQFQRASTMICASEFIRRTKPEVYGTEPISIGLWIGNEATPASYQEASKKLDEFINQPTTGNPFQLESCPWCGTEILPEKPDESHQNIGVSCSPRHFKFFCPHPSCAFHSELPLKVIDEHLYKQPPTLLLATVDKFARMPWVAEIRELFGGTNRRRPDLIIQDELHLISGPLGTVVGLYETAIDAILEQDDHPPKIIASTATIRNAEQQTRSLYNREVRLFPPSGLDASDSYFSKYDRNRPGRMYVGIMGQGHTAVTSYVRTIASILQGPLEVGLEGEALDAYWTLVGYHNSLRELGKTLTLRSDDIPAWIKVITTDQSKIRELNGNNVQELTSNRKGKDLTAMLDLLKKRCDEKGAISFLVSSNMISVGVDIQRLGLMSVNGQPKSSSEYIQATSRVGRGFPGLIITSLSATKPRDRSHYEHFIEYHSALYRFVEPGSVTPFSQPARERALHAVLISAIRHGTEYNSNQSAGDVEFNNPHIIRIINYILDRVKNSDPAEHESTKKHIETLKQDWELSKQDNSSIAYSSTHRQIRSLIKQFGEEGRPGWETMNSMRNVDRSCILKPIRR